MRFASTLENMGVSFINAIMTLIAFPAGAGNALRTCAGAADCRAHSVWSGDCRYRLVADGDRITGSGRDQTAGAGV